MYIHRNAEKGTNELSKSFVKGIFEEEIYKKIYTKPTHHAPALDTYIFIDVYLSTANQRRFPFSFVCVW